MWKDAASTTIFALVNAELLKSMRDRAEWATNRDEPHTREQSRWLRQ
jgi:hypothetical protein